MKHFAVSQAGSDFLHVLLTLGNTRKYTHGNTESKTACCFYFNLQHSSSCLHHCLSHWYTSANCLQPELKALIQAHSEYVTQLLDLIIPVIPAGHVEWSCLSVGFGRMWRLWWLTQSRAAYTPSEACRSSFLSLHSWIIASPPATSWTPLSGKHARTPTRHEESVKLTNRRTLPSLFISLTGTPAVRLVI